MPDSTRPKSSPLTLISGSGIPRANRTESVIGPDDLLQAVVSASASNITVLDESGTVLFGSKGWTAFETAVTGDNNRDYSPVYNFNCYERLVRPSFGAKEYCTLADDIQCILLGVEREFRRKYVYRRANESGACIIHAVRVDLPAAQFRVLLTNEEASYPNEPLKRSEARLKHLLEMANMMVWEADPDTWQFSFVSEQAVKLLGYPLADWYKPGFLSSHLDVCDDAQFLAEYAKRAEAGDDFELILRTRASDGRAVWLQTLVTIHRKNTKAIQMQGFMIDITEQKEAAGALRDVGARLIAAQEDERRRVARELHDDVNQRMAMLSIQLEQLGQKLRKSVKLKRDLEALEAQAREISGDIQGLSYRLHPSKLDHLGLKAALGSLCKEISESGKLEVELLQEGAAAILPRDVTLCIFRIAQEALRNCVKYSGALSAQVKLEETSDLIHLSVTDQGCGFDPNSEQTKKGLGFISMKERLQSVGGRIRIFSRPLHGTRIDVWVPRSPNMANQFVA
jgi:PAS domain S-box-containing protein